MTETPPDPRTRLLASEFDHASLPDWRWLLDKLHARFETGDFNTGVALVQAIGEAADEMDHHPDVDLTYPRVDVRLSSHDVDGVTSRDVVLARVISELAARLNATPRPEQVSALELALDTVDADAIRDFWAALMGYDVVAIGGTSELRDPAGGPPTIWFQEAEEHDEPHQRWHLDLRIPAEQVESRIAAAVEAGGTLVDDSAAPAYWVLADAQGNQACLTTWQGRD